MYFGSETAVSLTECFLIISVIFCANAGVDVCSSLPMMASITEATGDGIFFAPFLGDDFWLLFGSLWFFFGTGDCLFEHTADWPGLPGCAPLAPSAVGVSAAGSPGDVGPPAMADDGPGSVDRPAASVPPIALAPASSSSPPVGTGGLQSTRMLDPSLENSHVFSTAREKMTESRHARCKKLETNCFTLKVLNP